MRRPVTLMAVAANQSYFYRLNDAQEFIRAYNNNQFGIGYGPAWGATRLGNPAMVASNLGGFPFQPGVIDDPVFGQMLNLSVHRVTKSERTLLDENGAAVLAAARRIGIVAQDYAGSAFHVFPPVDFSHMEVTVRLPRGIHEETINGVKVTTGIDNTFVGIWMLPDLLKLSNDLADLQKTKGLSDEDSGIITRRFQDANVEVDILEAVGHSQNTHASIMTGAHLQGIQGQSSNTLHYDRMLFYNTDAPKWLQFMIDNNSPFDWQNDYLNVVFEFDADGNWRTYFNEIEMVNSKTLIDTSGASRDELLRRVPVRTVNTPVGPLAISYYIIFHAAPGGSWPGLPISHNEAARDGLRVANLLLR